MCDAQNAPPPGPQDNLPPGSLGDLAPDREMTFEEKRKLSAHMASIPGEKLVAVLDIIQEGEVRVGGWGLGRGAWSGGMGGGGMPSLG